MFVTSLQFADEDRDLCLDQIERLTHSHALRKAESLCKLLRYLADHALAHPGVALKEYKIPPGVLGRPPDFDPQADSAIRVQAGRLRLKLVDYYSHEGLADPIIVEMPNGAYTLDFRHRETPRPVVLPAPAVFPLVPTTGRSTRGWTIAAVVLSLALVATLAAVAALSSELRSVREDRLSELSSSAPLRTFWSQFASVADAPWVIFSNAAFVGRPETGMRYLDPGRDPR